MLFTKRSFYLLGYVPVTGLKRHFPKAKQFLTVCCLHNMLRCCKVTRTVRQAAIQIVNLATSEKYEGKHIFVKY